MELETIVFAFFSSGIWFLNVEALMSESENLNSLAFQIYLNNQEDWDNQVTNFKLRFISLTAIRGR